MRSGNKISFAELEKVNAETEKQKRLYEAIINSTPDLVYAFDLDYRFTFVNDAVLKMWGRTLEESIGKSLIEVGYEPWHAEMHEREIDKVIETGKPIRGEVPFPHNTQGVRIYDYIFVPVFNAEGKPEFVAGTTRDVTERKKAERTQNLLLGELNHRVKNTLATIQAIANQTLRKAENPSIFTESFNGRLKSLARSHSLLTESNWEGANIADIFHNQVLAGEATDRVIKSGPDVFLTSQTALHLSLVVFELATNALKYGALSSPNGRLNINWEIKEHDNKSELIITWVEAGGPTVKAPESSGFGMTLIEESLRTVDGITNIRFESTGFCCDITLPLHKNDMEL